MPPFREMYFHLFNAITDALERLEEKDDPGAAEILIAAQQWGENRYLEHSDEESPQNENRL